MCAHSSQVDLYDKLRQKNCGSLKKKANFHQLKLEKW